MVSMINFVIGESTTSPLVKTSSVTPTLYHAECVSCVSLFSVKYATRRSCFVPLNRLNAVIAISHQFKFGMEIKSFSPYSTLLA
jgi:hypothetical protein